MPTEIHNPYLRDIFQQLSQLHESKTDECTHEVSLDPTKVSNDDWQSIEEFIRKPQSLIFIFKIPGQENQNKKFAFLAKREYLSIQAKINLHNTNTEPQLNPYKLALHQTTKRPRVSIQIQKSYSLPKQATPLKHLPKSVLRTNIKINEDTLEDIILLDNTRFKILIDQLRALDITKIQPEAKNIILQYPHVFIDGVIVSQLPKGFYIDKANKALCYTQDLQKIPHALTPTLITLQPIKIPSLEELKQLPLPQPTPTTLYNLLCTHPIKSKNALCQMMFTHGTEVSSIIETLSATKENYILPLFIKLFIFAGETHTALIARLLKTAQVKGINLKFLSTPYALDALLNQRCIKNLQKLINLSKEQREWWNALTEMHNAFHADSFDFNVYAEAYTQTFLAKIDEKHLTLPSPCPIKHKGHMLLTLNRVLDVLEHATNIKEQCLNLNGLDWSALGVHFAMTQNINPLRQATANMDIHHPDNLKTNLNDIFAKLNDTACQVKPWLYRFIGQHWHPNINIQEIEAQLNIINASVFTATQKNKLIFILTTSFANDAIQDAKSWQQTLRNITNLLLKLSEDDKNTLLDALSASFLFKPAPSLLNIYNLLDFCLQLKKYNSDKSFSELVTPLISCLQNEGFELLTRLQERIQKTATTTDFEQKNSTITYNLISSLNQHRAKLQEICSENQYSNVIKLLTSLNADLYILQPLISALESLKKKKGSIYLNALINALSQINIRKSDTLPSIEQIITLLKNLTNDASAIRLLSKLAEESEVRGEAEHRTAVYVEVHEDSSTASTKQFASSVEFRKKSITREHNTPEKQLTYFKNLILLNNLLPGTVLGQGDISKLDDIIVEAFVDSLKKTGSQLDIAKIQKGFETLLDSTILGRNIVPLELKKQIIDSMGPLFKALISLVQTLRSSQPNFADIIQALKAFETAKSKVIKDNYELSILGTSRGDYILSLLLSGKKHPSDDMTSYSLRAALTAAHGAMSDKIREYFEKPDTPKIDGFNADIALSYLAQFNSTHSPMFLFKTELITKKVLPALKQTLLQLNLQDPAFEAQIIANAEFIEETIQCDQALSNYKNKIEGMTAYLNLLITLKENNNFRAIYQKLNHHQLLRLSYNQKLQFIELMLQKAPQEFEHFTDLTIEALSNQSDATEEAIQRALVGIKELFDFGNLGTMRDTFFKMSLAHNLKSKMSFPLTELNNFKNSNLSENITAPIIKAIMQIMSRLTDESAIELIKTLIKELQITLLLDQSTLELCLNLLERVSVKNFSADIKKYQEILSNLKNLDDNNRKFLATILKGLACNTKDDTVDLVILCDIAQGLTRRPADIAKVAELFASPPYPQARTLNSTLSEHGSERLKSYCAKFDLDPFAVIGKARQLDKQFSDEYIHHAITKLEDLMHQDLRLEHLKQELTQELIYINNFSYIDPLNPPLNQEDFYQDDTTTPKLQKLTKASRAELRQKANKLLLDLRNNTLPQNTQHEAKLQLLAYLREIYFRTTGKFLNSTQMLTILLAQHIPLEDDLLMRIKTGEGKSLITPFTAIFQWLQGGTVNIYTSNNILAAQGYENSYKPFFDFFCEQTESGRKNIIPLALITNESHPKDYQLNGINCSTMDDFNGLLLEAEEAKQEHLILNNNAIHANIDECDDAFFDKIDLTKLVAQNDDESATIWIDKLAYKFTRLKNYRNIDSYAENKPWDAEEDIDQFRTFLIQKVNEQYDNDIEKQTFILSLNKPQLRQWIQASCQAEKYVYNKQFIIRPIKEKDAAGNEITKLLICVPLHQSIPRQGSIFTDGVQQALYVRLAEEHPELAHLFVITTNPTVLASRSAQSLISLHHKTGGHIVGISGTVGELEELQSLSSILKTQAFGFAPHYGDTREDLEPIFTYSEEETDKAIQDVIKQIQKPIIAPKVGFFDESLLETTVGQQQLVQQLKTEVAKTALTQTRPILIFNEDFDEAKKRSEKLAAVFAKERNNWADQDYYNFQVIDGRETVSELDKKLRNAGKRKCITNSTAMLGRGIDIDTGEHPDGSLVIQTFVTGSRMTEQIKGRTARNGKAGQWQAIYQIEKPTHWLQKILHYVFPIYRKHYNQQMVAAIQAKIKEEATIEKIYNQAIDNIQNALMQHVRAWDAMILECFPEEKTINVECYNWRESLFKEIMKIQDPSSLSKDTMDNSINQFQLNACRIWETLKEEKWTKKADSANHLSREQKLKIKHLKALSLDADIKSQAILKETSEPIKTHTARAEHESITQIILDKAGAELKFAHNTPDTEKKLYLAQCKQLLPHFIAQFCLVHPEAIKKLNLLDNHNKTILPIGITDLFDKITKKDKKLSLAQKEQELITSYQKILANKDSRAISLLCTQLKDTILNCNQDSKTLSLQEQFKNKHFMLTFAKLYKKAVNIADPQLEQIIHSYDKTLVQYLAEYLTSEFEWAIKNPSPPDAWLEREVARNAAKALYNKARDVLANLDDANTAQELYKVLQNQYAELQDKFLFSVGHHCPRNVINIALAAIDTFNVIPACDLEFRKKSHDEAIINKHISEFKNLLANTKPTYAKSVTIEKVYDRLGLGPTNKTESKRVYNKVENHALCEGSESSAQNIQEQKIAWDNFNNSLINICTNPSNAIFIELAAAIKRFQTKAPQNFHTPLLTLLGNVNQSIQRLKAPNELNEDFTTALLKKKKNQFAELFKVSSEKIRLQSGNDGLHDYIDVQLEDATPQPTFTITSQTKSIQFLEEEEKSLTHKLTILESYKAPLFNTTQQFMPKSNLLDSSELTDLETINTLKRILNNTETIDFTREYFSALPQEIQQDYKLLADLNKPNWEQTLSHQDFQTICVELSQYMNNNLEQIKQNTVHIEHLIGEKQRLYNENTTIEKELEQAIAKQNELNATLEKTSFFAKAGIMLNQLANEQLIKTLSTSASESQNKLDHIAKELETARNRVIKINELLETQKQEAIRMIKTHCADRLIPYIQAHATKFIEKIRDSLTSCAQIAKDLKTHEQDKGRYQTKRFANVSELLEYEIALSIV